MKQILRSRLRLVIYILIGFLAASGVQAQGVIRITEYMYSSRTDNGNGVGEFFELTNLGNAAVNLAGWSFDDDSRTAGSFAIGSLGVVQPNESVIITDATAAQFRSFWFLPASVKVLGGSNQGLGRADEINIYDNTNALVTRLVYNDQGTNPSGTVRTQFVSAWPQRNLISTSPPTSYTTNAAGWQLSVANDSQNSYLATNGDLGNPGGYFITLPRVKVVESGGTTTVTEGGATDTYTIALNSQPSADVTIAINPGSQLTVNPASLTFTSANFSTAQTVQVRAIDDAVYQGAPRSVTITQSASSSDGAYDGITVNPVSVTIIDNDVPAGPPPTIQVANTTTKFISLPTNGPGFVSGVINDPTDPARTLGINFTVADSDTDVNSLTVSASSNSGNATLNLTGTGSTRNLKIMPAGVGYATITVSVTDGTSTVNYQINYAASAASGTPATTRFHTGTSDASTAIAVDANYTFVADDENQVLRLYDRQNSGLPVAGFDFTSSLGLTDISGGVPREVDLEASVRQNNRIFWIGSESNAEGGGSRLNRNRVFATDLSGSGATATLSYVGRYDFLRNDIINWDATNGHGKGANYYGLQASANSAVDSKQASGYNIEGAELAPDNNTVYIGFRAPQIVPANRTKALIVPVTNLTSLVNGQPQGSANFGAPIELDLGGRGIREIRKNANNQYIIIAGAAGDTGPSPNDFRLYTWTGNPDDAPVERTANLTALNVNGSFESIVEVPASLSDNTQIQLLVDNGDAAYYNDGIAAKSLPQNNFKKFRSEVVALGSSIVTPLALTVTASPTQLLTSGTTTLQATVSGGTKPYSYTFQGPGNITPNGSSATVSNLPAGVQTFTILVNDATSPTRQTISGTVSVTVTCEQITASLINSGPLTDTNPTVTLTATGGATYAFSFGATQQGGVNGNTATVTNPGNYQVTVTNASGCTATASTLVTGAVSQSSCRNGTAVIQVTASGNPVKYEWYRNLINSARLTENPAQVRGTSTSSLTLVNQQVTANYYVRVTDADGSAVVYGPFKMTVNLNCNVYARVGTEETGLKINLLGNPIQGEQIRAMVSGAEGKALSVQLLDLSGRPIRQQQWQQAESSQLVEWNLSGQASGVYLLQATIDADTNSLLQRQSLKVVKP